MGKVSSRKTYEKTCLSGLPTRKTNHICTDDLGSAGWLCKFPGPFSSRIETTNCWTARSLCSSCFYRNTHIFPTDLTYPASQHQTTNNRFTGNFRDGIQPAFPPARRFRYAFLENTSPTNNNYRRVFPFLCVRGLVYGLVMSRSG